MSSSSNPSKRSKHSKRGKGDEKLCDPGNPRKGTGLKVTTPDKVAHHIRQFSGVVSFYLMRNLQPSLPVLMLFGDRHMHTEQKDFGLCNCGKSGDCTTQKNRECCCFEMSNPNLYTLLMNVYGTPEHPVDVYTEAWGHESPPRTSSNFGGSMLDPTMNAVRALSNRNPSIRTQSADVRKAAGTSNSVESYIRRVLISPFAAPPSESPFANELVEVLLTQRDGAWMINVDGIVELVMRMVLHGSLKRLIRKEISKQRLMSTEDPQRPLTDPEVWIDVYRLCIHNTFEILEIEGIQIDPEAVEADRVEYRKNPTAHRQEGLKSLPDLRLMIFLLITTPLLDMYFVTRLLKQPCLSSADLSQRANCVPVWPKLALLFAGAVHTRNISWLLTRDNSPIHFYTNRVSIDYTDSMKVDDQGMNDFGDPFRCINLQEYDFSVNLDEMMRVWDQTFQ